MTADDLLTELANSTLKFHVPDGESAYLLLPIFVLWWFQVHARLRPFPFANTLSASCSQRVTFNWSADSSIALLGFDGIAELGAEGDSEPASLGPLG